jgi:hypothetical protein
MAVGMKDGLASVCSGVEGEPESAGGVFGGYLAAQLDQINQGLGVGERKFRNVRVMFARYNQNMNRLCR